MKYVNKTSFRVTEFSPGQSQSITEVKIVPEILQARAYKVHYLHY